MMSSKEQFLAALLLIVLVVLALSTSHAAGQPGMLTVHFLDVGQGDAILIQAPNGNQILIDGGPDGSILQSLSAVMPFYDRSIDAIVVTHPHADHIGGLDDVLREYEVGMVVEAYESYDSAEFRLWQDMITKEQAMHVEAITGRQLQLGLDVVLTILHPFTSRAGTATKTPHDDSVVALLSYKNFSVLLTGDTEADIEKELLEKGITMDADILKVGHHGSRTSTSQAFLDAVSPATAVIQVGARNRYGHPTNVVLQRLESGAIPYYRTDTNGTVTVTSNGDTFSITPEKK